MVKEGSIGSKSIDRGQCVWRRGWRTIRGDVLEGEKEPKYTAAQVSAAIGALRPAHQPGELGAPRAEQAGDTDHLPVVQAQVGGLERALAAQADRLEHVIGDEMAGRIAAALGNPVLRKGPQHIARAAALVAGIAVPLALYEIIGPGRRLLGGVLIAVTLGGFLLARLHGRVEGGKVALLALAALTLFSVVAP